MRGRGLRRSHFQWLGASALAAAAAAAAWAYGGSRCCWATPRSACFSCARHVAAIARRPALIACICAGVAPEVWAEEEVEAEDDGEEAAAEGPTVEIIRPEGLEAYGANPSQDRGVWIQRAPSPEEAVSEFLRNVAVYAVTDEDGAPVLREDGQGGRVGRFFMAEAEATGLLRSLEGQKSGLQVLPVPLAQVYLPLVVRGDAATLGGKLALQPDAREVRAALRRLGKASLGPQQGLVPLFLHQALLLDEGAEAKEFPLFLHEADLLRALTQVTGLTPEMEAGVEVTTLQAVAEQVLSADGKAKGPRPLVISSLDDISNLS